MPRCSLCSASFLTLPQTSALSPVSCRPLQPSNEVSLRSLCCRPHAHYRLAEQQASSLSQLAISCAMTVQVSSWLCMSRKLPGILAPSVQLYLTAKGRRDAPAERGGGRRSVAGLPVQTRSSKTLLPLLLGGASRRKLPRQPPNLPSEFEPCGHQCRQSAVRGRSC